MQRKPVALAFLSLFALFGLFLLGTGPTGRVISQSCCAPGSAGCSAENACAALQEPRAEGAGLSGLLVVLLALGLAAGELVLERKRRQKKFGRMRLV